MRHFDKEQLHRRLLAGLLLSATLIPAFSLIAVAAEIKTQPYDPRCEYLSDPVGIDIVTPRFS
jgi:hypothetical protein